MRIIEAENYQTVSEAAASIIIDKVKTTPQLTLGLATGGTPVGTYEWLVKDHQKYDTSYEHVSTYNLDEYVGIHPSDQQSYHHYMDKYLFNHINIKRSHIHIPDGTAMDVQAEASRYEGLIHSINGVDLQLLGIGGNGHIGFNEPGTSFTKETHIATLARSTREANARFFSSMEKVPKQAITMGIQTILKSKEILLLASGEQKAGALLGLIRGDISEDCPVSVLRNHDHVTVIADHAALSLIKQKNM
ncbi:glucosamine-6-phosphate deaminase [Alkalicoccobacillus porphyridii]|uniref:Glucosamine-6-phosphate deaminase n=1 Tax=Alkalicoccobacillus porphyridii TaxID=2597270 RepID=A0A554A4C5_9BACI|nr:glucosamine-6-phosphate deaminase [Alkalicoccobacillus porphyridii]TSB48550.1 glucosamine-6-phosphate deaminase [Alkalicoccobacillus porphyridii]